MSAVIATVSLGLHWLTLDPFLFCAHHNDRFPPGNAAQGVDDGALVGRQVGSVVVTAIDLDTDWPCECD